MKRRRANSGPTRRRQRPRVEYAIEFMGLLPEMHGEIVARLHDVADRAALARTCTTMCMRTMLPQLPTEWRHMLQYLRAYTDDWYVRSGRQALLELVAFGVPHWPGVFRVGQAGYDPVGYRGLTWYWFDAGNNRYIRLSCGLAGGGWLITGVTELGAALAHTLAAFSPDVIAEWRDYLATPRQGHAAIRCKAEFTEFDHD